MGPGQMLQNNVDLDFHGRADTLTFYGQYSEKDPGLEFENRPLSLSELAVLTQIPI
jgi:hypothetical protein